MLLVKWHTFLYIFNICRIGFGKQICQVNSVGRSNMKQIIETFNEEVGPIGVFFIPFGEQICHTI